MATIGNVLQKCATGRANTGYGLSCFTEFGAPIGVIFGGFGDNIPLASINAAKSYISGKLLNSNSASRFYPVQSPIDPKDTSEAVVVVTSTLGQKKVIRDGFTDITMQWWDGGMCLLIPLRIMNNVVQPFWILTSYGFLLGTDKGDGLCSGVTPTLKYAAPFKWSAGNDANGYSLNLVFDPKQTNEHVKFIDFNKAGGLGYLQSLIGLQNIILQNQSRVAALVNIGLSTSCGGVDLALQYPTQFTFNLWKAYADTGGQADLSKPIAITSSTPIADGYAIQLNAADANYTAAIAAPGTPTLTGSTTGGTLAAATYYGKQTALNAYGETIGSTEASATTTGSTSIIAVTNSAVAGATKYRTYLGTTTGVYNGYFESTTPNFTVTTLVGLIAGTVPATNTAGPPVWIGLDTPQNLLNAGIGGFDGSTGFEGSPTSMSF